MKDPQDDSVILCPECGLSYEPDELETITGPVSRFKNKKGKMLIQADKSKKKKMVSEQGDIIPDNDEDIKMDLARGHRVLAYKESLPNVEVMKK